MAATDLIWRVYQNSGPALQVILIITVTYIWRAHLSPRLDDIEQTQQERGDRWQEQSLNARERTLLLDDVATTTDELEAAVDRLRDRLRKVEQRIAAEHGEHVFRGAGSTGDDVDPLTDGSGPDETPTTTQE